MWKAGAHHLGQLVDIGRTDESLAEVREGS